MSQSIQQISSIAQAASEILSLINSQPRSPTEDEIAAILTPYMKGTPGEIAPAGLPALAELARAIAVCEAIDAGGKDDDESERAYRVLKEMEDAIRAAPPTSPTVLRAHALIARYYHRKTASTVAKLDGKPWVKPTDCDLTSDRGIAELIQAVLAYSGGAARRNGQ